MKRLSHTAGHPTHVACHVPRKRRWKVWEAFRGLTTITVLFRCRRPKQNDPRTAASAGVVSNWNCIRIEALLLHSCHGLFFDKER